MSISIGSRAATFMLIACVWVEEPLQLDESLVLFIFTSDLKVSYSPMGHKLYRVL